MHRNRKRTISETDRLILRTVTQEDVDNVYEISSDQEIMGFVTNTKSQAETQKWLDWILSFYDREGICFWAIELKATKEFIGVVGLLAKEVGGLNEIELVYRLKKEQWGKGYATEAARACEMYAFNELGVDRLVSIIHPENASAKKVAEKIGMLYEKDIDHNGVECSVYIMDKKHAKAI